MYKTNNRSSGKEQTMSKTKKRCPNCGSPVIIKGDRFECGWCGNFGKVSCLI